MRTWVCLTSDEGSVETEPLVDHLEFVPLRRRIGVVAGGRTKISM